MTRAVATLSTLLAASLAAVVFSVGGGTAAAYLALFALATVPGLPLGWALFGPRHAGGWIAGALLGYAASCLAVWSVVFSGHGSTASFAAAWVVALFAASGACALLRRFGRVPLVTLSRWGPRDTTALLLVLLLVPALVGRPFARIGSADDNGDRRYRAYFTADFVWHMALTAELKRHETIPVNPYLAPEPIHYYWTYFLVPAAAGPMAGADTRVSLTVNAVGTALLLMSAIFLATWAALPAFPFAVAGAIALVVLAASAEGLAAIAYVVQQRQGLAGLRDLNVDALSRGVGGLRIDNLPRAMWYTPQHSMSYALGLIALPVGVVAGVHASALAILVAGLALGASVAFNPFVGGLLSAVYAFAVIADARRSHSGFSPVLRHAVAIVPVAAALWWASINKVAEGAGGTLHFGLYGPARNAPLIALALSFGPLLVLGGIGLLPNRRVALHRISHAVAGTILVLLVMHLVTMTVDEFWIGFRTGHLVFVLVPPIVARGLLWLWNGASRRGAIATVAAIAACGLPTTVIDAYNAQDVENTHQAFGLRLTVRLTPEEQEGLAWIRANTPQDAVVQAEPLVRERDTWSLIPSFAERRMAAGLPISLMHVPEYDDRSAQVQQIYGYADPDPAWRSAVHLGIDYLWVDVTERLAYPNAAKFDRDPERFAPVFRNREVTIYRVIRDDSARTSGTR